VTPEPPKQEYVIAPPPPVVAPPPPPKPAVRRGISRISGDDPTYPREAIRAGVRRARRRAPQIDEKGNVTDVRIIVVRSAARVRQAPCAALRTGSSAPRARSTPARSEVNFTLKDECTARK
jgi:hypothetical protein